MLYFKTYLMFPNLILAALFFNISDNSTAQSFGGRQIISTDCKDARFVSACDLDDDGDMDVISTSADDDKVAWYENLGDANFGDQRIITTLVNHPMSIYAADLDGDDDIDLMSGSHVTAGGFPALNYPGKLVWIENLGNHTFSDTVQIDDSVYYPNSFCATDLDGDGGMDAVCGSQKAIAWYANDGTGKFGNINEIFAPMPGPGVMENADMDGDGDIDIVYSEPLPDNRDLYWFENEGDGSFQQFIVIPNTYFSPDDIFVTDLDGDEDPDILGVEDRFNEPDQLFWFENLNGVGTDWSFNLISNELDGPRDVYAADLDNDGDVDVLTASDRDSIIAWYKNNGSGGFGDAQIIANQVEAPNSVFAADLDNDGDYDVLSASRWDNTIAWYENPIIPNDVENPVDHSPSRFELSQNYPNPFNPNTTIKFSIPFVGTGHAPSLQRVTLKVYDLLGVEVATLMNEDKRPGHYEVKFNSGNISSGVYFYQLKSGKFIQTKKMLLIE